MLLEALLDGKAEALTKKAIEDGEGKGDPAMMRPCIERLIPPRKDRPINFELPALTTTQDASLAMLKILESACQGRVDPERGGRDFQGDRELRGHGSAEQALEQRIAVVEAEADEGPNKGA